MKKKEQHKGTKGEQRKGDSNGNGGGFSLTQGWPTVQTKGSRTEEGGEVTVMET